MGFIQINRDDGGRIRNISETGLCFEAFAPIQRERLLQFWFSLDLRERVEAKGRLAWLDPRREIGGLQFLDLSPKARRHLRTYLGAHAGPQPIAPAAQPVAVRDTDSAAQLAADFREYAPQSRTEEPAGKPKGSAFLKALAKYALGEPALSLAVEASVPAEPSTQPEYSRSEGTADLPAGPSESRASFNPLAFVSLERHLTKARKQLLRGVVLGIAIGTAAGWFLGRQNAPSQSPSAGLSTAQNPIAPPTPPAVELPAATATTGSATPLTARSASGRYVADNPPRIAVPPPSSSLTLAPARPRTQGTASPHGDVVKPVSSPADGAKAAKKSTATPQQLWASVQAGNMKAAVELADRFIRGDGVPTNCDQARVLLLVASEKKNPDAIKRLHDLDKTGCPPH